MNQQPPTSTHQATSQIAPIDPTPIIQSESPTAVILAIAILISVLVGSITGLVRVLVVTRSCRYTKLRSNIVVETDAGTRGRGDA